MKIKRERNLAKFCAVSKRFNGPRVLVADIETFPILAYVWGLRLQNISLEQIAEDWSLMSFAAKWLGHPEVFYLDNRDMENVRDDSQQCAALWDILAVTDMVIAHNGQRFDLPKIKARMVFNKLPPIAPVSVIDTLNLNRTSFGFTSQKLQYTTQHFASAQKDDHNDFPGWKLWLAVLARIPAAFRSCEKYNIRDITSNEEMYLSLRGWYSGAPNMGPYLTAEDGEHTCPGCGSTNVSTSGTRKTQVGIYQRYVCGDCGQWSRGRYLIVPRKQREHILMN